MSTEDDPGAWRYEPEWEPPQEAPTPQHLRITRKARKVQPPTFLDQCLDSLGEALSQYRDDSVVVTVNGVVVLDTTTASPADTAVPPKAPNSNRTPPSDSPPADRP